MAMLLSAMQELVEMKNWPDWDRVLNLSESDYPVKTQEVLITFLSTDRDNYMVKGHGREPDKFIRKQGLDKTSGEEQNMAYMKSNCKKVFVKVHCMMECRNLTTQKCRYVPMEPWRDKLDNYETNKEEEREMANTI